MRPAAAGDSSTPLRWRTDSLGMTMTLFPAAAVPRPDMATTVERPLGWASTPNVIPTGVEESLVRLPQRTNDSAARCVPLPREIPRLHSAGAPFRSE